MLWDVIEYKRIEHGNLFAIVFRIFIHHLKFYLIIYCCCLLAELMAMKTGNIKQVAGSVQITMILIYELVWLKY